MRESRPPTPRVMSDLLSTRLHALANLSAATTSLRVERKFGLTLLEWRSLGQLGGFAPLSLKQLAARAGLDKSYASRTISGLIERGLVASERNGADARGVMLSLTDEGKALYEAGFNDAVARNERLLAPLRDEQRLQLIEILGLLGVSARHALEDERKAAAGEAVDEPTLPAKAGASARQPAEGSVDLVEMRYLVARLQELVNPG
ncbi:MarR family transcriptional regulator [Achromobacter sp. GG226]|uniref:MarR family winged helix-turn-helix transcriptional regulator n=1 Tax=Verticiella alkaliphila TaxID=2779529 RepID=UPI001C0E02D8|nr:MarR family transcriptional regulator [Verticiella sp. GG226]MBU4612531.1 MarR family transcriptional regulator [Verticiella sp. GG226]